MKHVSKSIFSFRIFVIILLVLSQVVIISCKKKENPLSGVVTFVKGKVDIIRENGNIRQAKLKDRIIKGDDIRTGDNAFVILQFAKLGILRIEKNTLLNFDQLFVKNVTELFLINGKIISKIAKKSLKKDKFYIKTPTAVAGLRGTVFSIDYYDGEGSVSVKEGKIAVISKGEFKETLVTKGKTAIIKEKTKVRKSSKIESLELEKVAQIDIIPEIDNIEASKIDEYQKSIQNKEGRINSEIKRIEKITPVKKKKPKVRKKIVKQTLKEIKKEYKRIDKITQYNGKVIMGAITQRGKVLKVITPEGTIILLKKEIKNIQIIR